MVPHRLSRPTNDKYIIKYFIASWSSLLYLGKAPSLDCATQGGTLRVCTMGDEVNPCVTMQGETLQEVKGSERCIWPS